LDIVVTPLLLLPTGEEESCGCSVSVPYFVGVAPTRRFLLRNSRSLAILELAGEDEDFKDEAGEAAGSRGLSLEACCCSCAETEEGRLPIPLRRALNFRFTVAFIVAKLLSGWTALYQVCFVSPPSMRRSRRIT
jgi:hypothetical protein